MKVKWLGEDGGPDKITQYGVEFPRGKFVDVPNDPNNEKDAFRAKKFAGNPFFVVESDSVLAPKVNAGAPAAKSDPDK